MKENKIIKKMQISALRRLYSGWTTCQLHRRQVTSFGVNYYHK